MMLGAIVLFVWAVIGNRSTSASEIFATKPTNRVITAGIPVTMECSSDVGEEATIRWKFCKPSRTKCSNTFLIYNGKITSNNQIFSGGFAVDDSTKQRRDLKLFEINLENAGIYECTISIPDSNTTAISHSFSAELVVLAANPICQTNMSESNNVVQESDIVLMQCHFNYSGAMTPSFQWLIQNEDDDRHISSDLSGNCVPLSSCQIISTVAVQVNANDNGAAFECKLSFSELSNQTTTNASNAAMVLFQWNVYFHVEYGVRNVSFAPKKTIYEADSKISCIANGSPSPNYRWQKLTHPPTVISNSSILTLGASNEEDDHEVYLCIARNVVGGKEREANVTAYITIEGWRAVRKGLREVTIALGVVCLCLTILLAFVGRTYIIDGLLKLQSCLCSRCSVCDEIHEPDIVPEVQGHDLESLARGQNSARIAEARPPPYGSSSELHGVPVYASVNKRSLLHVGENNEESNSRRMQRNTYFGIDGTEYVEMNERCAGGSKSVTIPRPSTYDAVQYASIDHSPSQIKQPVGLNTGHIAR